MIENEIKHDVCWGKNHFWAADVQGQLSPTKNTTHMLQQAATYNSDGQVEIRLDERNNFCSTLGCGNHEHILGITQDGVVEENAKEHERQGKELLAFIGWRDNRL